MPCNEKSQRYCPETEAPYNHYRKLPLAHVTLICVCPEPLPQVTVMGQLPVDVFAPTFHVQLTLPAPSEFFVTRPAALEGPDL